MTEIVEDYTHPLPDLITPYATEKISDDLPYSFKNHGDSNSPTQVVYDLSDFANKALQNPSDETMEERVVDYFVARATSGEALKVAASIIKYNQTGELVLSLENAQKSNLMPFNMGEDFQRMWLKSCAESDRSVLSERLKSWREEESASLEEIDVLEKRVNSLVYFIPTITERKAGATEPGLVK